jgi:hypothetical protein
MVAIPAPSGTYQHISAISWILGRVDEFDQAKAGGEADD